MGRKEFTIGNVTDLIEEVSPPTPMDEDHDAVWWNTDFGRRIRLSFREVKDRLIKEIEQMAEY